MEKQIVELLEEAGIKESKEKIKEIIKNLKDEEVENIDDLRYLKETDISQLFGYKKIKTAKVMEAIKKIARKEVKVQLPEMPKDFSSIQLNISGKTQLNIEDVIKFIEFAALYGLGAETIGNKVLELVEKRIQELEEPADKNIINVYKLVSKFKNFESSAIAAINFELSLLPKRHQVAKRVSNTIIPAILGFINEALNFRIQIADIDSVILAKTLRTKKVDGVSTENILIAVEDLAVNINKIFAGLNKIIVDQALDLYKQAYNLIEDQNLQEIVGAKDTRDLMRKIGLTYSPKDVKSFDLLKELVYQMLMVVENDEILADNDKLYVYLQNVWNKSKLIDWGRFFDIVSTKDIDKQNSRTPRKQIKEKIALEEDENISSVWDA